MKACTDRREDEIMRILTTREGQRAMTLKDPNGSTLLHLAAEHNLPNMAQEILSLDGGKELIVKKTLGFTPTYYAAFNGYHQVVQALLQTEKGRGTLEEKDVNGWTPMHWAAYKNHLAVVQELLETEEGRVTIMVKTGPNGHTPMHHAAINGFHQVAQVLLQTEEGMITVEE